MTSEVQGESSTLENALWAERIYRTIFGSQLSALQQLRLSPSAAVPRATLERIYKAMHAKAGGKRPFDGWLAFLENSSLVTTDGTSYSITPRGTWFLDYLDKNGYTQVNPL